MYRSVTLEISLKPFKETGDAYITNVCRGVFEQWKPLIKNAETIKIMMWSSDGSELLDYRGNLDDEFEWDYMIGSANPTENPRRDLDPDCIALHSRNYLYIKNPPKMTYAILKKIVSEFKKAGAEALPGKQILLGTTIDVGPEFAKSDFKYNRHNEICKGNAMGHKSMVCAYECLNGDDVSYASYPHGIPDGTPFGVFFGKQANVFMKDMGFDYIWFSNGLGFGMETWSGNGAVFDGVEFDASILGEIKDKVLKFWELFKAECSYPIETRGTNMSMGIDYSTDGVPLKAIYDADPTLMPPPNSPWAALNYDFGLELMGHMSRIAYLSREDYLFRYYIHDPWWANSPWYDRYNSQPHDIYLPMALSRIDENGKTKSASHLNLLSIDNSFGDLPDSCVNEPIPHLLKAKKDEPDEVAPVVWIYPFDEYGSSVTEQELKEMYSGDWFVRGAINTGLPLTSVVTTTNFVRHDKSIYASSVLVSAVPKKGTEYEEKIIRYAKAGGKVIFYGNAKHSSEEFKNLVGIIETNNSECGEFEISIDDEKYGILCHNDIVCGGGLSAMAKDGYAFATCGEYAAATQNGNCIWVRGTVSSDYVAGQQLLVPHDRTKYFFGESLMRKALSKLGWEIDFEGDIDALQPVLTIHRHNNAYVFSQFAASTTFKTKLKFPLGAPVLDAYDTRLEDGYATYHFPKAEHRECRVFVEQESGIVSCSEQTPSSVALRRRVLVSGLKNATVRFLPETYCMDNIEVKLNTSKPYYPAGDNFEGEYVTKDGITYYEARNITGNMLFSMPSKSKD